MFEGEWEVEEAGFITVNGNYTGVWINSEGQFKDENGDDVKNLNAFATQCFKKEIELIINKEYELNENYEV